MRNKKGITLATCAQALALIFIMFMLISTFALSTTITLKRKENFVTVKAKATQMGYDLKILGIEDFIEKYTVTSDEFEVTFDDTEAKTITLGDNDYGYLVVIKYDNLVPEENYEMSMEFKTGNGKKLILEADYIFKTGNYEITSWLLKI